MPRLDKEAWRALHEAAKAERLSRCRLPVKTRQRMSKAQTARRKRESAGPVAAAEFVSVKKVERAVRPAMLKAAKTAYRKDHLMRLRLAILAA
jgi:hypothetical protein